MSIIFLLASKPPSAHSLLRHSRQALLLGTLAVLTRHSALAQPQAESHSLRVNVGLQGGQGDVVAKLYREGDDLFGTPRLQLSRPVAGRQARIVFLALAPGRYAVVVFHDINGNGLLDHNLLRLPVGPLGFSNGFELGLTSGRPDSRKLAFALGSGDLAIDIAVR